MNTILSYPKLSKIERRINLRVMNLKIGIQREIYQVRKWKRIIDYLTSPKTVYLIVNPTPAFMELLEFPIL